MAKSIILELQAMATDKSRDIVDLIRNCLLVAKKLKLDEFANWASSELHGYHGDSEIPAYRAINCTMKCVNPVNGIIPLNVEPAIVVEKLCRFRYSGSLASIVSTLETCKRPNDFAMVPLDEDQKATLLRGMARPKMEPIRIVPPSQLMTILDSVRTRVLEWALEIEGAGIIGDGLSFSPEEKQKAEAIHHIHIGGNFQGVLGNVTGSEVIQNLRMAVNASDFGSLKACLKEAGIGEADIADLRTAIEADPPPTVRGKFGPKVAGWIGGIINKCASGGYEIAVGAAGSMLAEAISAYYGL